VLKAFPDVEGGLTAEPWFDWLRFFLANGAVEFEIKSRRAADRLVSICRTALTTHHERAAACLLLLSEVLSWSSPERDRIIPRIFATWLNPGVLREALARARKIGKNEHHYIRQEEDICFWAFLQSGTIELAPPSISADLNLLRRQVGSVVSFGLAEAEDMRSELGSATSSVQQIYQAWGQRESDLERIRPFFSDPNLRRKILPLEIVVTGRNGGQETPSITPPRPTLGLPKQKGRSGHKGP
jgi:hypothetical protein